MNWKNPLTPTQGRKGGVDEYEQTRWLPHLQFLVGTLTNAVVMIKMTSIIDVATMKRFFIETLHNNKCQIPSIFRATITLYPIGRPVRTTITLYPIGRPVRATITYTLYPIGIIPIDAHLV